MDDAVAPDDDAGADTWRPAQHDRAGADAAARADRGVGADADTLAEHGVGAPQPPPGGCPRLSRAGIEQPRQDRQRHALVPAEEDRGEALAAPKRRRRHHGAGAGAGEVAVRLLGERQRKVAAGPPRPPDGRAG